MEQIHIITDLFIYQEIKRSIKEGVSIDIKKVKIVDNVNGKPHDGIRNIRQDDVHYIVNKVYERSIIVKKIRLKSTNICLLYFSDFQIYLRIYLDIRVGSHKQVIEVIKNMVR